MGLWFFRGLTVIGLVYLLLGAGPAKASLFGQTITCAVTNAASACAPTSAEVVLAIEFTLSFNAEDEFTIDVDGSSVTMTLIAALGVSTGSNEMVTLGDLFWGNDLTATITGISSFAAFDVQNLIAADITTSANSLTIDYSNTIWLAGSGFEFNIDTTTHATAVPEPASLALFGIGLAGLGFMTRRRRNRRMQN